MNAVCGIRKYRGDVAGAPAFLYFRCADAIRRLVWIGHRGRQTAEVPVAMPAIETTVFQQAAAGSEL